ncbi:MAG: alpha/beta hydrolase [Erysipelotrichaceae bacterium]|nr:alpha/beta hydrolase [Erysipelotrichaceae bacterium]
MKTFRLWEKDHSLPTELDAYFSADPVTKAAVLILPGGAYQHLSEHEGRGYAEYFNSIGMHAFVLRYSLDPFFYPLPLLDARRAVRYLRFHAKEFAIDPSKIIVVGSSAGGHLATLLSGKEEKFPEEGKDAIDSEDYHPSAQVLCYPVILSTGPYAHLDSFHHLLGERYNERKNFDSSFLVNQNTPKTFIFALANDTLVPIENTLAYAKALAKNNIPYECHIFQEGGHGIGLAPRLPSVRLWTTLLRNWLTENGFLPN